MEKEKDHRCGVCANPHFERNNYFYSKLMTVRDFFAEQRYFNEKRWLINRMISGWGVVCGLDVFWKKNEPDKVFISPGLAIDCCGREILICEEQKVLLKDVEPPCQPEVPGQKLDRRHLCICLEYQECKAEPVQITAAACGGEERQEFNRIRDAFRIRLRYASEVEFPAPHGERCPLMHNKQQHQNQSLHAYLCENLKKGCPECKEHGCVILAKITLCDNPQIPENPPFVIDPCAGRKLVYSNMLLADLLHCFHGDLPAITGIRWRWKFHEKDESKEREEKFEDRDYVANESIPFSIFQNDNRIISGISLVVDFNRPMNPDSICNNRHAFKVAAITQTEDAGYWIERYIPLAKIDYHEVPGIADECNPRPARHYAVIELEERWIKDELQGYSTILRHGADFKIQFHGSMIMGANGRALDGAFVGRQWPTGNGTQGSDFISGFSIVVPLSPKRD